MASNVLPHTEKRARKPGHSTKHGTATKSRPIRHESTSELDDDKFLMSVPHVPLPPGSHKMSDEEFLKELDKQTKKAKQANQSLIPSAKHGGRVKRSGGIYVHRGEQIIPAKRRANKKAQRKRIE